MLKSSLLNFLAEISSFPSNLSSPTLNCKHTKRAFKKTWACTSIMPSYIYMLNRHQNSCDPFVLGNYQRVCLQILLIFIISVQIWLYGWILRGQDFLVAYLKDTDLQWSISVLWQYNTCSKYLQRKLRSHPRESWRDLCKR